MLYQWVEHASIEHHIWATSWQNQQNDCTPSEDSDQPGHPPSLIRVFTVRMKKAWVFSYPLSTQWRLWSDWADAQADLSLRWAHGHFAGFVMRRLIFDCLSMQISSQLFVQCAFAQNLSLSPLRPCINMTLVKSQQKAMKYQFITIAIMIKGLEHWLHENLFAFHFSFGGGSNFWGGTKEVDVSIQLRQSKSA